jgi:hypothetical protein
VGSDGALQLPTLTQAEIAEILASTRSRSFSSDCTYDCSGHDAGYDWAEENDIDDPDDCGGNSNSFIEGCEQYAEEQQSDAEDERLAEEERAEEARREEEERSAEEEQEDSDY